MAFLTWMDIETIMQNEVSQKEKNKNHILTHTCGIQSNGTDEPKQKQKQKQTQRTNMDTKAGGGDGLMDWKIPMDKNTLLCIEQVTNENLLFSTGNPTQ